jgi:hypothetical protein
MERGPILEKEIKVKKVSDTAQLLAPALEIIGVGLIIAGFIVGIGTAQEIPSGRWSGTVMWTTLLDISLPGCIILGLGTGLKLLRQINNNLMNK